MYDPVANEAVTIRDALSHRSGIARGELAWLGAGISRDEVLRRVRFLKPESPFRSRYSYQNMMFLAAGQAAGKAAGASWDDLIRQRIFTPLGMTAQRCLWCLESRNRQADRRHGNGARAPRRHRCLSLPRTSSHGEGHGGGTVGWT